MYLCVQFEVVLRFKQLFTDLAFESADSAVSEQVSPEISLAGENLHTHTHVKKASNKCVHNAFPFV